MSAQLSLRGKAMSATYSSRGILFVSFNQDYSCISIGTRQGYKIFNCDTCSCCHEKSEGAISIAEMLFCTSLVAIVGAGEQPALSPRRLVVTNTAASTPIAELNFVSSILAVRMNRKRLVVVLERKTHIHDLGQLSIVESIDTAPNSRGLCALSSNPENCYLALPASKTTGAVLIYDALNAHAICQIQAHVAPLAALAFSEDGLLLASASEKGTVIRVHSIPQATKAYTFRRGAYPSTIYSLAFGPSYVLPTLLAATSESGTVHVFKLDQVQRPGSATSKLAAGIMAAVMPESMSDMLEPERCFITIHNGFPPSVRSLCAIVGLQEGEAVDDSGAPVMRSDRVRAMVVTAHGYFYEYTVDLTMPSERAYNLERECALVDSRSEQIAARFV